MKVLTLFSLLLSVSAFAEYDGSALLEKGRLIKDRVCYNECKPKKKILGLFGDKKEGDDRKNCIPCLQKYPELYTVKADLVPKEEAIPIPATNKKEIGKGDLCYDECKDHKKILGLVGKESQGKDRKSCVKCLGKYPEIYTVDEQEANLCIQAENNTICASEACYKECKPKKQILGLVGKKENGLERNSCLSCMKANPDKYKIFSNAEKAAENNCTLSTDRIYAYCDGKTYKLDGSIAEGELSKDVPVVPVKEDSVPNNSTQAQ